MHRNEWMRAPLYYPPTQRCQEPGSGASGEAMRAFIVVARAIGYLDFQNGRPAFEHFEEIEYPPWEKGA